MRRFLLIFICFLLLPSYARDKNVKLQNIFITDTTEVEEYIEPDTTTLKGYAEYVENSDAVVLKNDNDEFVLNLKIPQKISSKSLLDNSAPNIAPKPLTYSKFDAEEYKVIPRGRNAVISSGNLSFGTTFDEDLDTSEFEQTAGIFTSYNKGKFGLKTSYKRTIGSTYNNYSDNIYFAPELRLNKMFTIRHILSANIVTRRKKSELVLSIKPFAFTNNDRLNLEIGAGQTYSPDNELIRSKIRFNTRFKL